MRLEYIIFVLFVLIFSVTAGTFAKLYSYGVRGRLLYRSPLIPFNIFVIVTKMAFRSKDIFWVKFVNLFKLYMVTIKYFPILIGLIASVAAKCELNSKNTHMNLVRPIARFYHKRILSYAIV